jgi:hypothetical protein
MLKYKTIKIGLILVVAFLLNVNLGNNVIEARQTLGVPDMIMVEETCWATGELFDICRAQPNWYCVVASQDACSSDPGEN